MKKLDLRKELKHLYAAGTRGVEVVDVPPLWFAIVDGAIEPGRGPGDSPAFNEALEALYGVSYTLKFLSKQRPVDPIDYSVMGLEALWWVEAGVYDPNRKDDWRWTAMILQPEHITAELFAQAVQQVRRKRGESEALAQIRLERLHEGPAIQLLHVGPYATEPVSIARMVAFSQENGYQMYGKHHEIYLGDPRRAAPEKLKTLLRHPVRKASHEQPGATSPSGG